MLQPIISKDKLINHLKAYDIVIAAFYTFLTLYNIVFYSYIDNWKFFVAHNVFIIAFTYTLAYMDKYFNNTFWRLVHYWYIAPLIVITFKELYYLIHPVRQQDYDYLFIQIDRFLFGGDPTVFLYQFAHPVLTEILQIVYGIFYLLPVILALVLIKNKRYKSVDYAVFSVIYGFYLSYLGYFALPAVGPRFTLHNFDTINLELPGLWLTNYLREFTNIGESIPSGTPNPIEVVQRDVFPSGHTMITLITMYLSFKMKSRSRYFLLPVGALLIFSTVYLRYHYVIDLIGGLVFMMFSLWSGRYLFNWWQRIRGQYQYYYGID